MHWSLWLDLGSRSNAGDDLLSVIYLSLHGTVTHQPIDVTWLHLPIAIHPAKVAEGKEGGRGRRERKEGERGRREGKERGREGKERGREGGRGRREGGREGKEGGREGKEGEEGRRGRREGGRGKRDGGEGEEGGREGKEGGERGTEGEGGSSNAGDNISNHSWSHISCHFLQRDILTPQKGLFCDAFLELKCT